MKIRKLLASVLTGLAMAVTVGQLPAAAAPAWVETFTSGTYRAVISGDCASFGEAVFGCPWPGDDSFNVRDTLADGHSAAIVWQNFVDGALYRRGACVEKRGNGAEGSCNMNFYEGSEVQIRACTYESGRSGTVADKIVQCGPSGPAFRM